MNQIATPEQILSQHSRSAHRLLLPLLAAGISITSSPALALELGDITVHSHLGQPLRASIAFALGPNEQLADFCVALRPGRNASGLPGIGQARISVASGTIRLTGSTPILEPLMAAAIVVDCPYAPNFVREYTLLVNPVEVTAAQPVMSSATPARAPAPAAAPRAARTPEPAGDTAPIGQSSRYQVQPGDSLSTIVQRIENRSLPLWPAVNRIFAANPEAFLDNDPNRLKAGAWLTIPGMDGSAPVVTPSPATVAATTEAAPQPVYETPAASAAVVVAANPVVAATEVVEPAGVETPAADPVIEELVGDEPVETLRPGDILLDSGVRVPYEAIATPTVDTAPAAAEPTQAARSVPISVVRSEPASSSSSLLGWLAGAGTLLLAGLLLFGRRLRERFGSTPVGPAAAMQQPASAEFEAASIDEAIDYDLTDESPTDENPTLDADLLTGSGFDEGSDMDLAQDFGFAATTDLDIELPFEPVAQAGDDDGMMIEETDIIRPMRGDAHSILESEVLPEDGDYDLSVIMDATKMPFPEDVTERDLMAVEIDSHDDSPTANNYTISEEADYSILEQDYQDELTATQALNLQIELAAAELAARMDDDDAAGGETTSMPALSEADLEPTAQMPIREEGDLEPTAQMPIREEADEDTSMSGALTVNMATADRRADNDETAEMEIEGGTVNTKAR